MPIVFLPLTESPEIYGWGSGEIRLQSFGMQVASNWSVGYLPSMEAGNTGGESLVGSGAGDLPLIAGQGWQTAHDGWSAAYLPLFEGWGLDDDVGLVPFDGTGEGDLPAFEGDGAGGVGLVGSAEVEFTFTGLGFQSITTATTVGGYGAGYLPLISGAGIEDATLTAGAALIGPTAYITAWAGPTQGYLVDFIALDAETEDETVRVLREILAIGPTVLTLPIYRPALTETLQLRDTLRLLTLETVSEIVEWVLTQTVVRSGVTALVERLVLSGAATTSVNALAVIAEAMAVHDVLMRVLEGEITELETFNDQVDVRYSAFEQIALSLAFSDTVEGLAVLRVDLDESLTLADTVDPFVTWIALLSESVAWSVSLTREGVPFYAMALNTTNKAISEYTNFDFNSLATFNGVAYGAGAAGLYRLDGADDAGVDIDAFVRTAMHRVAGGREMTPADAYLGLRTDGNMQLKVVVNNRAGQRVGYVFDMIRAPTGAAQPGRFKLGKGLKSVYMAFELSNSEGSDFAADVLEIRPLMSYRRVP